MEPHIARLGPHMSISPVSSSLSRIPLPDDGPSQDQGRLPASIDGGSEGKGWGVATDPHAQPSDGSGAQSTELASGRGVTVSREQSHGYDGVVVTTTDAEDRVTVDQRADGTVDVTVNGETTNIKLAPGQQLEIRSEGGNDTVTISEGVTADVTVYGGAGDDQLTLEANGEIPADESTAAVPSEGHVELAGEDGDDTVHAYSALGGPRVYAFGGEGNDEVVAYGAQAFANGGNGDDVVTVLGYQATAYAGEGNDTIYAAGGEVVVDTGGGADEVSVRFGDATVYGDFNFWSYFTGEHDTTTADPGASVTEEPR